MSDLNLSVEDTELQLPDHGSFFWQIDLTFWEKETSQIE